MASFFDFNNKRYDKKSEEEGWFDVNNFLGYGVSYLNLDKTVVLHEVGFYYYYFC